MFTETDRAALAQINEAVAALDEDLPGITAAFEAAASGSGPDFADLRKLLKEIGRDIARYEPTAAPDAAEAEEPVGDGASAGQSASHDTRANRAPSLKSIVVLTSREDALRALELSAAFFRANEPSSPLPLLIDRATRLAALPFIDILRDLAPDGLQQAQIIVGPTTEA